MVNNLSEKAGARKDTHSPRRPIACCTPCIDKELGLTLVCGRRRNRTPSKADYCFFELFVGAGWTGAAPPKPYDDARVPNAASKSFGTALDVCGTAVSVRWESSDARLALVSCGWEGDALEVGVARSLRLKTRARENGPELVLDVLVLVEGAEVDAASEEDAE